MEVKDTRTILPYHQPEGECFSLIFSDPVEFPLPQQIYPFRHERLGEFPLFIVPVGRAETGRLYQAVFNRTRV